jgi:hypothetical protein
MLGPRAAAKLSEDLHHLSVKRLSLSQPVGGAEQLGQGSKKDSIALTRARTRVWRSKNGPYRSD